MFKAEAESMEKIYLSRLQKAGNISSLAQLQEAMAQGKIDLSLDSDKLVPRAERERILRENPEVIRIGGKEYPVKYNYNDHLKPPFRFQALVRLPLEELWQLDELPKLPSGRFLTFNVVDSDRESIYIGGESDDADKLKEKVANKLIQEQFSDWQDDEVKSGRNRNKPKTIILNSEEKIPPFPEPVEFGGHPLTGEPLLAYWGIDDSSSFGSRLTIKLYSSKEEAEKARVRHLAIREAEKAAEEKRTQKDLILTRLGEIRTVVYADLFSVRGLFGLEGESKFGTVEDLMSAVEDKAFGVEIDFQEINKKLAELAGKVAQLAAKAQPIREAVDILKQKVAGRFSTCPLCGERINYKICVNTYKHDSSNIDFPADIDGREAGPAVLVRIKTEEGKIVAEICCSSGNDPESFRLKGEIYVIDWKEKLYAKDDRWWRGEKFTLLVEEGNLGLLSAEEIKKRKEQADAAAREKEAKLAREKYRQALEMAKAKVEEGIWREGQFKFRIKPGTKNQKEWFAVVQEGEKQIIYVFNEDARKPISPEKTYFFKPGSLVAQKGNQRMVEVTLEEPYPINLLDEEDSSGEVNEDMLHGLRESFT